MRSCLLDHHPLSIGQQALTDIWKYPKDRLVYPFFGQEIEKDPSRLLRHLFSQAPADRFWMHPNVRVLALDAGSEENKARWMAQLTFHRFGSVDLQDPFPVNRQQPLFHIHAGASQVVLVMSDGHGWSDRKIVSSGGLAIDRAIAQTVASKWRVLISMEDARALKETASGALLQKRATHLKVTGLDQRQGFVEIEFPASDLWPAIESVIRPLARTASEYLCSFGVETMDTLTSQPVLLSGGLALCAGLKEYLEQYLKCPVDVPENPADWLLLYTAGCV